MKAHYHVLMNAESKIVIVGSTSPHKLDTINQALQVAVAEPTRVKGVTSKSRIHAQQVGNEETPQGALNRLTHAKEIMGHERWDLVIGIENGIIPVTYQNRQRWFDYAWVVVEDSAGHQALANSAGVEFAERYVRIAQEMGFATTTV